jgi:hypothetical protein
LTTALSITSRMRLVDDGGRPTREFLQALQSLVDRTGGATGPLTASQVSFSPTGGLSSTDAQSMGAELDAEKQPVDATLTALAALVTVADRLIYATGADAFALTTFTAYARTLLDDVDASTARGTLGLGTIATQAASSVSITGGTIGLTSGSLGYATGNGGTVTQATSKATGVTLNKVSGDITLNNAALAANTTVSFTLTNSTIAATDLVLAEHNSAGTNGAYKITAQVLAGGASLISVTNRTGGSLSEAIVIRFAVFKGATS